MSEDFVKVSKEDLVSFSKLIYSKALCGYADLEDSVCISESNKLFNSLKQLDSVPLVGTSDMTISTNQVGWTFSSAPSLTEGTYFVSCNPYYNCTVPLDNCNNSGFSSPLEPQADRQLLLFDNLDSNIVSNNSNDVLEKDSDGESLFQDFESNEGHIYL